MNLLMNKKNEVQEIEIINPQTNSVIPKEMLMGLLRGKIKAFL